MHIHRRLVRGASFLSFCEIANQGSSFARNIILARFLTKADFGVATMLGMVLTLFEMSNKMGLSQQVVQSKQGDDPSFIASVQFTQLALGVLSTLLILAFSWPLAQLFSGPDYFASIMVLALVPILSGLNHLDVYRFARRLGFGPQVLSDAIPQLITTLAAWPLALYFKDYRAVLWILVGRAFATAIMTHALAERPFSLSFNAKLVRDSVMFGLPLLLTGFVQFGNAQGDSMVIAAAYPLEKLGEYSVALTLAMAPGLAILRVGSSVSLPLLAEVQFDTRLFAYRYSQYVQSTALIGCAALLGMVFCGEDVVVLAFGAKYRGVGTLACWLMAGQSLRILRGAANTAALARGDTVNALMASIWRFSGLALAVAMGLMKASLVWFAVCCFTGELIAFAATVVRLKSRLQLAPRITLLPAIVGWVCVLVAVGVNWAVPPSPYSFLSWFALCMTCLLTTYVYVRIFPEFKAIISKLSSHLKARWGEAAIVTPVP